MGKKKEKEQEQKRQQQLLEAKEEITVNKKDFLAFLNQVIADVQKNPNEKWFARSRISKVTVKTEAARTPGTSDANKPQISHELTFIKTNIQKEHKKERALEIVRNINRLTSQLYQYCNITEPVAQFLHNVGVAATASPDDDNNTNNNHILEDIGIKRIRRNRILAARNAFDAEI